MGADGDRAERAGNFVRGLMGEAERERAQRDLEIDPQFREAVMDAVGRIRAEGLTTHGTPPADSWGDVAARLAALPQMQAKAATAPRPQVGEPRVTFGRRKTDFMPMPQPARPTRRLGTSTAMPGSLWLAVVLALAITCAFLVGYVAGVHSAGGPAAGAASTVER